MQLTLDETSLSSLDSMGGIEALCAFIGENDRPLKGLAGYADWRMCGTFSKVLRANHFTGAYGDCLLYPDGFGLRVQKTFLFGMGSIVCPDPETLRLLLQNAMSVLEKVGCRSCAIELPGLDENNAAQMVSVFVDTCLRGFHGDEIILLGDDVQVISKALQGCADAIRELDICLDDRTRAVGRKKKQPS